MKCLVQEQHAKVPVSARTKTREAISLSHSFVEKLSTEKGLRTKRVVHN